MISEKIEMIELLNKNGLRTGKLISRKELYEISQSENKFKRLVQVYFFDKYNNLLIAKSSQSKRYPGQWGM